MRIELLGTGGYHPSDARHTACVLMPQIGLVLDAGTGAYRLLSHPEDIPGDRLDIVLTHAHLDHIVGLTYLIGLQRGGRSVETVVHARAETLEAVRNHLLSGPLFPVTPVSRFEVLGDSLSLPSGAEINTFPLDHPGGSLGVRVESGGKSLAYVTDTRPVTGATIEAIRGVDLLLHEAYFGDARRDFAYETGHCTASQAAEAAVAAEAKRLLMVHPDPRADAVELARAEEEARGVFAAARYAADGQAIDLGAIA